jgi:hypothetical protein
MRRAVNHAPVHSLDDCIDGAAQPCGTLCYGIEHGLDVRRRTGDHPQDLTRRRLLLQPLAEGTREALDLPLQVRIGRRWRASLVRAHEGRTTRLAEHRLLRVLVAAPGTLHTAPSQRIGARNGSDRWRELMLADLQGSRRVRTYDSPVVRHRVGRPQYGWMEMRPTELGARPHAAIRASSAPRRSGCLAT